MSKTACGPILGAQCVAQNDMDAPLPPLLGVAWKEGKKQESSHRLRYGLDISTRTLQFAR